MRALLFLVPATTLSAAVAASLPGFPDKIYGVNLGSWLLLEPWMLPGEWQSMGGENNCDCSTCIGSEFALVKANPRTADKTFNKHWTSWFTQGDVDRMVDLGINTARIPLGYWIVESLVKRDSEFYPRGGFSQLRRGLKMLKAAGITAILDHHALPGVQATNQQFAGRCTTDVQFYTDSNYRRALVWTAVMTFYSHLDRDFSAVASIEAVNEPLMDASQTPGYGQFQKDFVAVVRAVEEKMGISGSSKNSRAESGNLTTVMKDIASSMAVSQGVRDAVSDALPILTDMGLNEPMSSAKGRRPLVTSFMDINWQNNNPSNPADAAQGPQGYDNHLYYSFGGVADPNEEAYMKHICNLDRIQKDAEKGNSPLWFGEWGLPTQFQATDAFLKRWADAQKLQYSKDAGWVFWNFKIEKSKTAGDLARQWSYFEGVDRGYLTKDPQDLNDPNVCAKYTNS